MVQLTRTIFLGQSLSYAGIKSIGRDSFGSSHMKQQAILQCLSHLLDFILTVWCLKHVLIKKDFERKWYVLYKLCGAACKLLVFGGKKGWRKRMLSVS